ncbi:MAG TPA: hypothetical protein DDW49_05325, partial [Deltaproteobacteria bacterium]|nr:hypothetical protein [Deltaproteobacteria bacterium]
FGGRLFLKRTNSPPPAFVFVGAGFLGLIIGLILMMWGESRLGALLFLYGGFLGPVLGIGSFLIPMILGNPVPANTCSSNGQAAGKNCPKRKLILSLGLILFLFVSFYLEAKGIIRSAYLLRASVVSFVLLKNFRILKKPTNSGMLAWILQISCWALLVGFWPSVLWPSLALHFNHIIFIGTVSLMIFGVITRVSLAHGGFGFEPEKKSRALMMVLIFLLAALLMRVMAPFFPQVYFSHLAYASIFWILAAFIWLARFIRCLLKNH